MFAARLLSGACLLLMLATACSPDAAPQGDVGDGDGRDKGDGDGDEGGDDEAEGDGDRGDGDGDANPGDPDAGDGDDHGDSGTPRNGFPEVADLTKQGPFATTGAVAEGPDCSVHRPATLGEGGVRHPVVIWGMGTGGFNTYGETFELWASHGFIVAAALLGHGQGDGAEMLACLDHVCATYAEHVDCRAGASGHSQGGGGALMAGQDLRVITTAPIQPYIAQGFGDFDQASITNQTGPMLLLSGTADTIASPEMNQKPVFETTNVPVFWANLVGGDHVATGIDGAAGYRSVTLAWFRLQLMNDQAFHGMFYGSSCTLCSDPAWEVQQRGL